VLDSTAFDVALGLIFVYLVLSLVCTAVNETAASIFAWRADTLREGIANLLGSDAERKKVYAHPIVSGLIRKRPRRWWNRWQRREERYPSYIPANVFTAAVLNPVKKGVVVVGSVDDALAELPEGRPKQAMQMLWEQAAGDVNRFRASLETWYDEAMSRVSGWYRRRVQVWLWVWALAVSFGLHVDTIQIATALWTDDATRAAVVARAERAAGQPLTETNLETAADNVQELEALRIPIGWSGSFPKGDWVHDAWVILLNGFGMLLTAVALTLGAPFWFDLLKKVANVRSAGKAPTERPVEKPGEAGEPAR
jgi:hypothetical protein